MNGLKRASAALIIIESISYMYNVIKGHRAKAKKKTSHFPKTRIKKKKRSKTLLSGRNYPK